MEKLDGKSMDIVKANIEVLKKLFPEVVTEGKIDFEKLKLILGEEIETRNEKYEFTWHGKTRAMKLAQTPSTGTLRPDKASSKNWDTTENLYIEGDNLEVLKLLQKSYFGKIKMIYIEATLPTQAIQYCKELFKIESELESLTPKERKKQRQERSKPILEAFWSWVNANRDNCLPKSKLYKAFNYAINQKEGLMQFLEDGNISITNNLAENSIRPFTLGRKNWLFSGSPEGAKASAAVYSIIETAKANDINPYNYLLYIFKYMPGVRFDEEPEWLEDFLPWHPDVQAFCKNKASK